MYQVSNSPLSPQFTPGKTDEEFSVRWVSLDEFKKNLSTSDDPLFHNRLNHFLNQLTPIHKSQSIDIDYYQAWLNISAGSLRAFQCEFNLEIYAVFGPFESNALTQESSQETNTHTFLHIKIFDEEQRETPLIQLRINPQGNIAELVYIQKGEHLSGNQMKDLALCLLNTLKPDLVYLNDDAKFTMETPTVPIRSYLPLISPTGETWYGKDGFSPLFCKNLQTSDPEIKISQDPTEYYLAVAFARNMTIKNLYQSVLPEEAKPLLLDLCKRYLPHINMTNIQRNMRRLANVKLCELGCELYKSLSTSQGKKDFAIFVQQIISRNSDSSHSFYQALDQIYLTSLWKYSYKDSQENTSFLSFQNLY